MTRTNSYEELEIGWIDNLHSDRKVQPPPLTIEHIVMSTIAVR